MIKFNDLSEVNSTLYVPTNCASNFRETVKLQCLIALLKLSIILQDD
ncbi:447_t:CDS:2, partial [Cetraspora pellucida]